MARIRTVFLAGAVVILPAAGTIWLLMTIFNFADGLLGQLLPAPYNSWPGLGLLLTLAVIFLAGLLTTHYLGQTLLGWWEEIFRRVPLVRGIYNTISQLINAFTRKDGAAFSQVVLVEYPRKGLWSLALVTGSAQKKIEEKVGSELLGVFVPTTPNPTSGYLIYVPKEDVIPLEMSVQDGMRLIISGGTAGPEEAEAGRNRVIAG